MVGGGVGRQFGAVNSMVGGGGSRQAVGTCFLVLLACKTTASPIAAFAAIPARWSKQPW